MQAEDKTITRLFNKLDMTDKLRPTSCTIESIEDFEKIIPSLCKTVFDFFGKRNLEATYQRVFILFFNPIKYLGLDYRT